MHMAAPVRILIYAAVRDEKMLEQGFYLAEADGLRAHPRVAEVRLTNRLGEVLRGQYDALVSYFYSHSAAAATFARLRGRPVVVTGGAEQLFPELAASWRQHNIRLTAFRLTAATATRLLATSTSDLHQMRRLAPWATEKIELSFHGAAAVERPATDGVESRPAASFVTICGLDTALNIERKGIPETLALLNASVRDNPDAYLTIIGRTTCRDLVEQHATALGVTGRVRFAGYVSEVDKIALLRAHRYYVQLSTYEGFGIGALEALAQGCQVIHSGAGGLGDTIAHFGVVLPPADAGKFLLAGLPRYAGPADPALAEHLSRFQPSRRADTIVRAMSA